MGAVWDKNGKKVGSVNAWSGVYDANDRKVGDMNIFTDKVWDNEGYVGSASISGKVYGITGRLLCDVAFYGSKVRDADGNIIGEVGLAGAPEPMPDMQWRGAAALILLCHDMQKEDIARVRLQEMLAKQAAAAEVAQRQRQKLERERLYKEASASGPEALRKFFGTPEGKVYKSEHRLELMAKGLWRKLFGN